MYVYVCNICLCVIITLFDNSSHVHVDNEVNEAALKCLKQEDLHRMNLSLGGRRILERHLRQLLVYYMHTRAVLSSILYIMHTDLFAA